MILFQGTRNPEDTEKEKKNKRCQWIPFYLSPVDLNSSDRSIDVPLLSLPASSHAHTKVKVQNNDSTSQVNSFFLSFYLFLISFYLSISFFLFSFSVGFCCCCCCYSVPEGIYSRDDEIGEEDSRLGERLIGLKIGTPRQPLTRSLVELIVETQSSLWKLYLRRTTQPTVKLISTKKKKKRKKGEGSAKVRRSGETKERKRKRDEDFRREPPAKRKKETKHTQPF